MQIRFEAEAESKLLNFHPAWKNKLQRGRKKTLSLLCKLNFNFITVT